jgi:ubiquinone/menaquinone biosynthesis C-methylase UbiE
VQPEAVQQFAQLSQEHWWFRGRRAVYSAILASYRGHAQPHGVALDLGGGAGSMTAVLEQSCERVITFDREPSLLTHAKDSVAGDLSQLPFADASFDVVAAFDVLEHVLDEGAALREIERVSRGASFITVDAWRTEEEHERLLDWILTAESYFLVEEWVQMFSEEGYTGDYWWFIP